uniref:B box-type domain-containing protein n=1 Tax=Alexandrium andersonii TaxID=327968 RepID=A0A7S2BG43_9DINO
MQAAASAGKYVKDSVKGIFLVAPGKSGPPSCANCAEKGAVYCVDCKKSFCRFCAVLLHHPSTKLEKHSMEEIDINKLPVKILSPVLLDLCLIFVGAFLLSGPGITAEYFSGNSYCPALSRGRRWLAKTDANLFFYYKAHLAKYCDWEDSYWRFFMDTWVRGILTDTDAWLLIISQAVRAVIFEEFLRVLVTPAVAVVYAFFATMVRLVEWEIALFLTEAQKKSVNNVGEAFAKISFATSLAIKDKKPPPPATLRRKRPMTDWVEGAKYWYDRHTRLISYYRAQAQAACRFVLWGSLKVTFFVRVVCMVLGHNAILSAMKYAGFGDLGAKHVSWFSESSGMDLKRLQEGARFTDTSYSDWLAVGLFWQVVQRLPVVGWLGQEAGGVIADGFWALLPILSRVAVPVLCLLLPPALFFRKIARQKASFADQWKKSTVKEIYGEMSRKEPAKEWEKVTFSPQEAAAR